jgi:hypothetical protein
MDLEKRYKDETGYDVGKIHDIGMHYCSNDYVEWLEKLVNKNSDIHSVSHSIECYECRSKNLKPTEYKCNDCGHNGYYD